MQSASGENIWAAVFSPVGVRYGSGSFPEMPMIVLIKIFGGAGFNMPGCIEKQSWGKIAHAAE